MKEILFGRNAVYESLRAGRRQGFRLLMAHGVQEKGRLTEVIATCNKYRIPIERVPRQQLDRMDDGNQGVALECSLYPYSGLPDMLQLAERRDEPAFILILDALQDPQNLGSLLRTAEAVGVHGVLLPLRQTVTVTPAVVNASAGASEHMLIAQVNLAQAIQSLKDANVWVIGLDGDPRSQPPSRVRLDGALALVVGSEGQGMRQLVRESCDVLLRLPMQGKVASLNAAVAGSIGLYMASMTRHKE